VPAVRRVLETALYVDDLARARAFYDRLFAFPALTEDERLCAYDVGGVSVLLLFKRGGTLDTVHLPGGTIPPHDGHGPLHLAFAIDAAELPVWEQRLADAGVPIEGRTHWPRGGESLYVRDPDGHLVELATPGDLAELLIARAAFAIVRPTSGPSDERISDPLLHLVERRDVRHALLHPASRRSRRH
jgi:catechol 2,3-dioxygenase-like lactoylglutathione lyase family enzyme